MKRSLSNVIFWCCVFFFMKQKQRNEATKNNKKTRKKRQEEKDKTTRKERERDRVNKEKREDSHRREEERHCRDRCPKTILFQRKKVFLHKRETHQEQKEGWRPTAQEDTFEGLPCPQSQRGMRKKDKSIKTERGGCDEDHENVPHRSRKAIFGNDPNSNRRRDTAARPLRVKFARAPEKMRKLPFSKRPRFCSTKGFFYPRNPISSKFRTSKNTQ